MPPFSVRAAARFAVVPLALLVGAPVSGQTPTPDPGGRDGDARALFGACRAALDGLGSADASAEGLVPVSGPFLLDEEKVRATPGQGGLVLSGSGGYRPTYRVPELRIRWECVADPAAKQVRSVRYAAVDAAGAEVARPAAVLVRDAVILESCRPELEAELADEAEDRGAAAGGRGFAADAASISSERQGKSVVLTGTGRARLSKDFEWQAVTFGCRWEQKKDKVSSAWLSPADAPRLGVLSPERQELLDGCKAAVADAVRDDAARRGYRWPREEVVVELARFGEFASAGTASEVRGEGWFKPDARHREPTPITFRCVSDPRHGGIASATFEVKAASRTPSGEIASGMTGSLVCKAYGTAQKVCAARIRGSVKIVRELGRTPCEAYRNWIWSLEGITVWGGCAAEFEFEAR